MHRFRLKPPLRVRELRFFALPGIEDSLGVSLGLREDTPEETKPSARGTETRACLYDTFLRFTFTVEPCHVSNVTA